MPPVQVPPEDVLDITRIYESGRYVQASIRADAFQPIAQWQGTEARILGGRIAGNMFAPRLALWLISQAWRHDRQNPEAAYYYATSIHSHRGPLAAWRFLKKLQAFPDADDEVRALLLSQKAVLLGEFRDFERAGQLIQEAMAIDGQNPWTWICQSMIAVNRDAYDEALEASRHALELRPWYRPALNASAHHLQLLGRDEEALELLQQSSTRLESSSIFYQMALLQTELGQHAAALESWHQVRALSPWMEPKALEWWEANVSDAHYFAGDLTAAADAAERSHNPFHEKLVARLRAPAPEARRVILPVGFVRQHHMTCAPATLSALSRYWQMPVDHEALAATICYDGTPEHVERHWALENGWHAREFRVTWDAAVALIDRGVPFTLTTVETRSAHLQALVGYDSFRKTMLIRDPYARTHREWPAEDFFERYSASGPRGMVLLPPAEISRLDGLELPDAEFYDHFFALQRAFHTYDRAAAEKHLSALETAAPEHRLALEGRYAMAHYDGSLTRQFAAVEKLLAMHPKSGRLLWDAYALLRHLSRQADCREFLRQRAQEEECEPLFWQEWATELGRDATRSHDATRLVERALRVQPVDPDHLQARANLLWEQRDFSTAAEYYRFATCLRDKIDSYARSYFVAARHLRQTDTALAMLVERFERFGSRSAQPTKLLFAALASLNRQPEAFSRLEVALAQRPDDGDLLLFAADAFARHGDSPRGAALLQAAESRAPRAAWLRTAASLADYRCDLRRALELWREVLQDEPLAIEAQRSVTRLLAETEGKPVAVAHLAAMCEQYEHHIGLHELWAEWAQTESNAAVEPVLRRLLALHPEHAFAHRQLAITLIELRRPEEAAAELDFAEKLEPHTPAAPAIRAQLVLQTGRFEEARSHARSAVQISVDYNFAVRMLLEASPSLAEKKESIAFIRAELVRQVVFGDGLIAFRQAAFDILDPHDLLAELQSAKQQRPDLWHAWSALTLQLADMKMLDQALASAREATERFPLLPRLWIDLARVFSAFGHWEEVISPLQRALQIEPTSGEASRDLAENYQRMGRFSDAAEVMEQAVAASPLDPLNHGCLATALWQLGRKEDAVTRLEHALKLDPGYSWGWAALRAWSPERGRDNRAQILARELTVLRPGEARSWYILAQSYDTPAIEDALAAIDRALELQPRFTDAHDLRATVLAEAGRFEEAQAACVPAVYASEIPDSLRGRSAWIIARQGRLRAAIACMQEVVDAAPQYYWGWTMLAEWHSTMHDFAAAEEAAQRLARLNPQSVIPLGYLADLQMKGGKSDEAYETLRKAFALDPTYAFAGFALFDHHLLMRDTADAGKVLDTLSTHLPGPRTQSARVRFCAQQRDLPPALEILRELVLTDESGAQALHTAVHAMIQVEWGIHAEPIIRESLENPKANPEVGAVWIRYFVARDAPKAFAQLERLSPDDEIGRRAHVAYIEELGANRNSHGLAQLIRKKQAILRKNPILWGTVGFAYVRLDLWQNAVNWMQDAPQRQDVEAWMLLNYCIALRALERDSQALAIHRQAVALPRDHSTPTHLLWLAFAAGLRGDVPALDLAMAEVSEPTLGDFEKRLLILVKALRGVHGASQANRRRAFKQENVRIATAHAEKSFGDVELKRARRQCLKSMEDVAGDFWTRFWPSSLEDRIQGAFSALGNIPKPAILIAAFCSFRVLAALLNDSPASQSPPPIPVPAYRPSTPSPTPPRARETIILPFFGTPQPFLATPAPLLPPPPPPVDSPVR